MKLVPRGLQGPTGPAGADGAAGATGPQGVQGRFDLKLFIRVAHGATAPTRPNSLFSLTRGILGITSGWVRKYSNSSR